MSSFNLTVWSVTRNLKTHLLDSERYKEELRELLTAINSLEVKISKTKAEITKTKADLNKCKMDNAMPKGYKGAPKFNKDTKVSEQTQNSTVNAVQCNKIKEDIYRNLFISYILSA